MNNLIKFNKALHEVTQDRAKVYDPLVRNALRMIGVKMARLVQSPDHLDSVIDIAGYARTIAMINDRKMGDPK